MYDVGGAVLNNVLTVLFLGMLLITVLSLVPWSRVGVKGRWPLYLPLVFLATYVVYEWAMPPEFDIRVDLLLLIPLAAVTLLAWGIRVVATRRG